jgi:hypothetical protein
MKIVYIAEPLTTGWDGKDREHIARRIKDAETYGVVLANAGIGFFCPHAHTAFHHEKGSVVPEDYYYELGGEFLKRSADAVLAMPGWENSVGAKFEVELGIKNNLPIFYPKSIDDLDEIIKWANN